MGLNGKLPRFKCCLLSTPLKVFVRALHKPPAISCYTPFTSFELPLTVSKVLRSDLQFTARLVQIQGYLRHLLLMQWFTAKWVNIQFFNIMLMLPVSLLSRSRRSDEAAAPRKTAAHSLPRVQSNLLSTSPPLTFRAQILRSDLARGGGPFLMPKLQM